jgi:hypothetical protein
MPAFHALHYFQPMPPVPSEAVGVQFMKRGSLRVQSDIGAGLNISLCQSGVCVEEIDCNPGQPDLKVNDVIVAIDGSILCGLEPKELEEHFEEAFQDAARLIIIAGSHLSQLKIEEVQQAAQQMLRNEASHEQDDRQFIADSTTSLPRGLCPYDADDGVTVSDDGYTATSIAQGEKDWLGVRGRPGILHGRYQYEVQL